MTIATEGLVPAYLNPQAVADHLTACGYAVLNVAVLDGSPEREDVPPEWEFAHVVFRDPDDLRDEDGEPTPGGKPARRTLAVFCHASENPKASLTGHKGPSTHLRLNWGETSDIVVRRVLERTGGWTMNDDFLNEWTRVDILVNATSGG